MNIWIINEYAGSPYHGMEFRHYYLGKEFVKLGHNVTIVTASYSHLFRNPPNVNKKFTLENIDGIKYIWIRVPKYKKSTDIRRVLKWIVFSLSLFLLPFKNLDKPDVIILSPMATFPVLPTYILAKKYKAKFIFEVKDIWPLTLVELGGVLSKHPLVIVMKWLELFALKKADVIVSVLPNYGEYLKENNINKGFIYIPNGIDLEELENGKDIDEDIKRLIPKDKFIVGYVGTIGVANALDVLIKAANILRDYKDIAFVVVGNGSEKDNLIKMVKDLNLENVVFIPSIPKRKVQEMLKYFDVCYIGWRIRGIYKYGISPNKIFDYMYSGKPIIHAINTEKDIVSLAKCGVSIEAENPISMADAILKLKNTRLEDRLKMGLNGKKYVVENHDYRVLTKKFLEVCS